eukprot:NODE_1282_length_1205_cov_71.931661_g1051_i0.p1 GENE.NODE_1282_length_1205_cov_71.931661_g1051_i0~~NODE_1282_length_1205_cov_71.931661_g1051_i0.p1  ORF type:complete len:345 (+),score=76.21 NODE_1282_length_1205_cov_71.931661_g1051_i0:76-1110(+)
MSLARKTLQKNAEKRVGSPPSLSSDGIPSSPIPMNSKRVPGSPVMHSPVTRALQQRQRKTDWTAILEQEKNLKQAHEEEEEEEEEEEATSESESFGCARPHRQLFSNSPPLSPVRTPQTRWSRHHIDRAMGLTPPELDYTMDKFELISYISLLLSDSSQPQARRFIQECIHLDVDFGDMDFAEKKQEGSEPRVNPYSLSEYQARYVALCNENHCQPHTQVMEKLLELPGTTVLDLSGTQLGKSLPYALRALRPHNLTRLVLSNVDGLNEAMRELHELVRDSPSITSVDLSNNPMLAAAAGRELIAMAQQSMHLLELNCVGTHIPPRSLESIAKFLESNSTAAAS